jgi:PilZ domain
MGRRNEPRIAISYPVVVRGFDSQGNPFSVAAETYDISYSGASLKGIEALVKPGKKVEIEFRDQKAWFSVQWVGKSGSPKAGRTGVHCVEQKYIWSVPVKQWEPDIYNQAAQSLGSPSRSGAPWLGGERRLFPRRACRIEVQFWTEGSSVRLWGRIADLSRGGCYVETLAPLPVGTVVELALAAELTNLRASGRVRTSQAGLGMGIEFIAMSAGDTETLRKFAPPADRDLLRASASASRSAAETSGPTTAESLEAVVRALLRKGIITQQDLAEALEKTSAVKL